MDIAPRIAQAYLEDASPDLLPKKIQRGRARLVAREDLVLAGRQIFQACLRYCDQDVELNWNFKDGDLVLNGQAVAWIKGDLRTLVRAERVALDFLGHLSGIATLTRCFVQEMQNTSCSVRAGAAMTPLWRDLEAQAVEAGGGAVPSAVVVNVNAHAIQLAGSVAEVCRHVRELGLGPTEVECQSAIEIENAIAAGATRVILSGLHPAALGVLLEQIPASVEVVFSGHIKVGKAREYARTGVQWIRIENLTHSAPAAEFALQLDAFREED